MLYFRACVSPATLYTKTKTQNKPETEYCSVLRLACDYCVAQASFISGAGIPPLTCQPRLVLCWAGDQTSCMLVKYLSTSWAASCLCLGFPSLCVWMQRTEPRSSHWMRCPWLISPAPFSHFGFYFFAGGSIPDHVAEYFDPNQRWLFYSACYASLVPCDTWCALRLLHPCAVVFGCEDCICSVSYSSHSRFHWSNS